MTPRNNANGATNGASLSPHTPHSPVQKVEHQEGTFLKGIWVLVAVVIGCSLLLGLIMLQGLHGPVIIHQDLQKYVASFTSSKEQAPQTPGFTCTQEQAQAQEAHFKSNQTKKGLKCASDTIWIHAVRDATGPGPLVMLDVGCNKGYFSAQMFHAFHPELGFNKKSLWEVVSNIEPFKSQPVNGQCATCDTTFEACVETPPSPPTKHLNRSLTVHCFEAASVNFRRLFIIKRGLKDKLGPAIMSAWVHHRLPMSRQYESVMLAADCEGTRCSLTGERAGKPEVMRGPGPASNLEIVQASSIDDFVNLHLPGSRITVLKIDAEGYDPEIIRGSSSVLSRGLVDVLFFEYHSMATWAWPTNRLPDLVATLEQQGMVCYFQGVGFFYKLSRGCWAPAYEIKSWSNVVCGRKSSWVEPVLDKITWLYKAGRVQ